VVFCDEHRNAKASFGASERIYALMTLKNPNSRAVCVRCSKLLERHLWTMWVLYGNGWTPRALCVMRCSQHPHCSAVNWGTVHFFPPDVYPQERARTTSWTTSGSQGSTLYSRRGRGICCKSQAVVIGGCHWIFWILFIFHNPRKQRPLTHVVHGLCVHLVGKKFTSMHWMICDHGYFATNIYDKMIRVRIELYWCQQTCL
jgi:hypothetical protein